LKYIWRPRSKNEFSKLDKYLPYKMMANHHIQVLRGKIVRFRVPENGRGNRGPRWIKKAEGRLPIVGGEGRGWVAKRE